MHHIILLIVCQLSCWCGCSWKSRFLKNRCFTFKDRVVVMLFRCKTFPTCVRCFKVFLEHIVLAPVFLVQEALKMQVSLFLGFKGFVRSIMIGGSSEVHQEDDCPLMGSNQFYMKFSSRFKLIYNHCIHCLSWSNQFLLV